MPRLFIAVDLPQTVKENLRSMSFGIPGAKWVSPEQLHLTVRFIGEVDGAMFHDIKNMLDEISLAPFPLELKGVGFFPPRGNPRVLWVGIEKNEPLQLLRKRVDYKLLKVSVKPEGRKL